MHDGGEGIPSSPPFYLMEKIPSQIILTLRANAVVGKKFQLTVELLDRKLERLSRFYPEIILSLKGEGEIKRYKFRPRDRGIKRFSDIVFLRPGIFYIEVRIAGGRKKWLSNPVEVFLEAPRYRLWWGEIHGHTNLSDSFGTIDEHYRFGRDVLAMDIYAAADHTEFPKTDPMTSGKWKKTCRAAKKYYRPHEFVTFLGFEWTSGTWFSNPYAGYGHRCVYYLKDDQPCFLCNSPGSHTPQQLFKKLDELKTPAIVIPHHPAVNSPYFWVNWDFYNPRYERLVEIYSMWGNSERSVEEGNVERPVKRLGGTVKTGQGNHVQDALRKGCRTGIIAGSDAHDGLGGRCRMHIGNQRIFQVRKSRHRGPFYPNGLLAVYSSELTRESVFEAMYKRRVYGTTCARIMLKFLLNGHWMGEEIKVLSSKTSRCLQIEAAGTGEIDRITVVKNCQDVYTRKIGKFTTRFEYLDRQPIRKEGDHYYIRLIQKDGEMAWSSPVWVDLKKSR